MIRVQSCISSVRKFCISVLSQFADFNPLIHTSMSLSLVNLLRQAACVSVIAAAGGSLLRTTPYLWIVINNPDPNMVSKLNGDNWSRSNYFQFAP
jgi:hypothetical protein